MDNLGQTVEQAKANAGEGFGLRQQFEQRPLLMFGAAVAAGYVLGSADGKHSGPGSSMLPSALTAPFSRTSGSGQPLSTSDFAHRHTNAPAPTAPPQPPHAPQSDSTMSAGSGFQHPSGVYQPTSSQQSSGYQQPSSQQSSSQQSSSGYQQPSGGYQQSNAGNQQLLGGLLGPLGDEFDSIKMAAVTQIRHFLRDTVREAVPSMRERVDELDRRSGRTPPTDKGLVDPNEGRGYVKTYHPSK
jgi:hypothetical protein